MRLRIDYPKYFFVISLVIILVLLYHLLKPFFQLLLLAAILAYLLHPLYHKLDTKLKKKRLSASIMTVLALLVLVIPAFFAVTALVNQSISLYSYISESDAPNILTNNIKDCDTYLCNEVKDLVGDKSFLTLFVEKISTFVIENGQNLVKGLVGILFGTMILAFTLYFMFKDGDLINKKVHDLMPLRKEYKEKIIHEFDKIMKSAVVGVLISALLQGFFAGFGFWLIGKVFDVYMPAPILLGFITAVLGFIPLIGPTFVYVPLSLFFVFNGNYPTAITVFVYGAVLMSMIDNFIKPTLMSRKTQVHPLLMFLSVIGGLQFFGFLGIFLGPIIAAFFMVFLHIYEIEWKNNLKKR